MRERLESPNLAELRRMECSITSISSIPETFQPAASFETRGGTDTTLSIIIAANFGATRLIDNIQI